MEKQAHSGEYAVFKAGAEVQYGYFPRFLNVIVSNKTIIRDLYSYKMTKLPSVIMNH
jgi:hypothetical protein